MSSRLRQIFAASEPSDVEAAERRQQLAQAMQTRALQPTMNDPRYYTGKTALTDLASSLIAAVNVKNANKAYQRAKDAKSQSTSDALKRYQESVPDEQVGAEALKRMQASAPDELPDAVEPRSKAYQGLVNEMDPDAKQQMIQAIVAQQMTPKEPRGPIKLNAGDSLVDPTTFKPVYAQPAAPSKPLDPLGQLEADRRAGLIDDEGYKARKRLLTTREAPAGAQGWRDMTPQEISAAGLPPGTAAQRNSQTSEINVITKRDNTGALSQKDVTAAKTKLNTVSLARQQLNAIKQAFEKGRKGGLNAFGPGQGMLPTQQGKMFDARVDQMRSTLSALTRTPGVGAMSDYETKLDQSKFPARGDYETVTADKLAQLDDMLNLIEGGYTNMLGAGMPGAASGGPPQATQPQAAPDQQQPQAVAPTARQEAPPAAIDYLRQHPEAAPAFQAKYGYLP